jgi:hypothetical protein
VSRGRAAAAVFAAALAVFLASRVRQVSDSYYSLLVAEQLVSRGTLDLAEHFRGELPLDRFPGNRRDGMPYQVKRYGERVLYEFPLGAPLLATPWMAVAHVSGRGVLGADGYDRDRERRHQRILAALLAALFVAGAFVAADRLLPRRAALWATAALALATPVWSTASRGLWSHTAALALLGAALPLLAARQRGAAGGAARLGLLAAGAYACRPTASIVLALLGLHLARRDRRAGLRFAAGATAGLAVFTAVSWATWGSLLPPYYLAARLTVPSLESIAGVLVSPGRGLFVYLPALAAALAFGLARWGSLAERPLFALGAAGVALHAAVVASFPHWWGGHGYGPRLFTETVFFVTLIAASVAATLVRDGATAAGWRRTLAALAVAGAAIHGAGALSNQSNRWNWSPREVDEHPERLWDWRDPQFLAWANRAPREGATIGPPRASGDSSQQPP